VVTASGDRTARVWNADGSGQPIIMRREGDVLSAAFSPLLAAYQNYYNTARTHLGIARDSPDHRPIQALGAIVAMPALGGLHHHYVRI
jgi:hypothetical protein